MSKVIIYGISTREGNLNSIRDKLSYRYEVIGYMDSFYNKDFYQYKKVIKIEELSEIYYDYIIINSHDQTSDNEIYNLLCKYGVIEEKIVRYAKYAFYNPDYPIKCIENKMEILCSLTEAPAFWGFLVGMSYAEIDIDVNKLSKYIYNCAHASVDLFYRKLMIESLISTRTDFENTHVIILELPYYIFNYDFSLCDRGSFQSAMNYIAYWDNYHHFLEKKENRIFQKGFSIFKDMFLRESLGNSSIIMNNRAMTDARLTDKELRNNATFHAISKCHKSTIEENRAIFQEIVEMILKGFSSIKLVILVCPQPSSIRKLYDIYPLQKNIFLREMELIKKKYPGLIILDEQELFIEHDEYFSDSVGHLNKIGCDIFTDFLDKKLKKLGVYGR